MSDTTDDTTTSSSTAAPTDDTDAPAVEPGDTPDDTDDRQGKTQNSEAAKYRTRLREVEKERDKLAEQVTGHHRAAVERLAAEQMSTPGDLWLAGVELSDMLDDDGELDGAKVTEAVDAVLGDRPHWRRASPAAFDGGARESVSAGSSWAEVLRGDRTRRT